ncbi:MAG: glutamate formimidoyltransferase [Candidatus Promineifilaceae bacterium]
MQQLVECVPNFSDGRRPEVIEAIAAAIRETAGISLLDISSDRDHNRTVMTFAGRSQAAEEAAFRAIAKAAELINLDEHEGEHPRIGATDVCPFVPVAGVTEAECVALAQRLGQRVGDELGIAVYLYGAAASRPERQKLADIRRGQYEAWKTEVASDPARRPDFGPAEPRPWGATVIGVRPYLIAYNIYLNSDRVEAAKAIAKAVRYSSGGLREVQALGFLVDGQAQVSMNLTDFSKTPIHRAQELVRREAARHGLSITHAELVGLTPQKALLDAARWYLQLDGLSDDQVLEIQLAAETAGDISPYDFLEATAAGTPTPGGGSVAALAGALAAALTQMVARLTIGRKKYAEAEERAQAVLQAAAGLGQQLTAAIRQDAAAFEGLMAAWKDKSADEQARSQAIEAATIRAAEVPLGVARLSREAAELALEIAQIGNQNAATDAAAAAVMAQAAVRVAALNVRVNAVGLERPDLSVGWTSELEHLEADAGRLADEAVAAAAQRAGF